MSTGESGLDATDFIKFGMSVGLILTSVYTTRTVIADWQGRRWTWLSLGAIALAFVVFISLAWAIATLESKG